MASPVAMASPTAIGVQPESDGQLHQQVLTSLQQHVQQLDADVLQLTQDMKHTSLAHTQVTHPGHTQVTHTGNTAGHTLATRCSQQQVLDRWRVGGECAWFLG